MVHRLVACSVLFLAPLAVAMETVGQAPVADV